MATITIEKDNVYAGNLLLVNADYPLHTTNEHRLVAVNEQFPDVLLKREAVNFLQFILKKIHCINDIIPVSGYRSLDEQQKIYDSSLKESGAEFTRQFVALPNHSEHQTGLAIDLGIRKDVIDFICPDFPYRGISNSFREIAPMYGYIERYPKGKESITGIAHEPWHFRYVGYPHSEIMYKNDLTLEEYIDYIKEFSYPHRYILHREDGRIIEVFYVPAIFPDTTITLPEQTIYQISGNNADGYIVTLWRN